MVAGVGVVTVTVGVASVVAVAGVVAVAVAVAVAGVVGVAVPGASRFVVNSREYVTIRAPRSQRAHWEQSARRAGISTAALIREVVNRSIDYADAIQARSSHESSLALLALAAFARRIWPGTTSADDCPCCGRPLSEP